MPAFIRYPLFGCVILALSACGGSGSSRLLDLPTTDSTPEQPSESYPGVEYLIMDVNAVREKYGTMTTNEDGTTTTTPAPLPSRLSTARDRVVLHTNRYLSTGGALIRTDSGSVVSEKITATCTDETTADAASCTFPMDTLRAETTLSFGLKNPGSLRFAADRQPVMSYRGVDLSQVRTAEASKAVYKDGDDNEYLLTRTNVANMNLNGVALPDGVTTLPAFTALLAVYEDAEENEYLLTSTNVDDMNLDGVTLPDGVTTAPEFASLSVVRKESNSNYVGYDGILQHSMFFVGVDRFLDEDGDVMHLRLGHASLGRIYDDDTNMPGAQMPTVSLTGEGVMVGVESEKNSLEHYLVQGDVGIDYSPFDDNGTPSDTTDDVAAMIDIEIMNIMRLTDDGPAWYADASRQARLRWTDLEVATDSTFSGGDLEPLTATPGKLEGSFYGTKDNPEVGGVFHHDSGTHEIVGSFGSTLSEPDPENGN